MGEEHQSRRANDVRPGSSSIEIVAPEELQSKPVSLAVRYWNALRGTRPFPTREEIVPRDMVPFLRNVVVARVIDGGRDYEYRIAGDAYVQAFGFNFKGMLLSETVERDADYAQATRAVYEYVRNLGQPFALRGWIAPMVQSRFSYHETAFFPLGKDGVVDHLLATTVFTPRSTDAEQTPVTVVLPNSWKGFAAADVKKSA
jgi:hypothetical protein